MQSQDEARLIAQSIGGAHESYAVLIDNYKQALYRHCFTLVKQEDIAEDIVQEAFITAYYKLASYKSEYRFGTWLFKIATNKALNWLKKQGREVAVEDEVLAAVPSPMPQPQTLVIHKELMRAVNRLPPHYCAVISLYYWQGLSYEEIAVVLDSPVGSIKGWMSRAKEELRKEIV